MVLENEKLNYPFTAGLDQETDPRVMPQNLEDCTNGVWRRDGRLEKRPGLAHLYQRATAFGQQSLLVAGDAIGTIGQNDVNVVDSHSTAYGRVSEGTAPALRRAYAVASETNIDHSDVAYCDGYVVVVYTGTERISGSADKTLVFFQVFDDATGAIVIPETIIYTSPFPDDSLQARVENVSNGSTRRAHIFFLIRNGATFFLRMQVLTLDPIYTLGAQISIATISACGQPIVALSTLWHYDTSNQSGKRSVVVFWNNAGVPALTTKRISPDGTTISTFTSAVTQGANRGQVCIYARAQIDDGAEALILYQQALNTTVPQLARMNAAWTAFAATLSTGMPVLQYNSLHLVRSDPGFLAGARRILAIGNDATPGIGISERIQFADTPIGLGGAVANRNQLWGRVVMKPYYYVTERALAAPLAFPVMAVQTFQDSAAQPHVFLVALYALAGNYPTGRTAFDMLPIGRLNVDTAQDTAGTIPRGSTVPVRADEATGPPESATWICPLLTRKQEWYFNTTFNQSIFEGRPDLLRIEHETTFPVRYAEHGDNAYIAGGSVCTFGGGILREQAFNLRPYFTAAAVVGASIPVGTYQYVVTFERYDDKGDLIRSERSLARSLTLVAPNRNVTLTIRVPVYVADPKNAPQTGTARIVIFRTVAGGSLFFRVATLSGAPPAPPWTTWPTVTYSDTALDATLTEPLYSDSGRLEADPPPAPIDIATYQERVAIISGQDPDEVWISQIKEAGVGVEFSSILRTRVPAARGDLTALAAIDEKLVMFKKNAIYAIAAEGPNPLGQGDFGQPREVSSDVGCVNKHSVVVTEAGVLFESAAGIQLLDRALGLTFVGGPVVDEVPGLGKRIARAISIRSTKEAYFLIQGTNKILCLNYRWNRWSVHEIPVAGDDETPIPLYPIDIANVRETLVALTYVPALDVAGVVLIHGWEDPAVYADIIDSAPSYAAYVPLRLRTPWMKLAGLLGWQRTRNVRFLAEFASDHDLKVRTYHDNEGEIASGQWTFASADIDPGDVGLTYNVKVKLPRQKSMSVQFEFEDAKPAAGVFPLAASGFRALSVMLEYGVKLGGAEPPVARKG